MGAVRLEEGGGGARARDDVLRYFAERFGVAAAAFDPYGVLVFGSSAWLVSRAMPDLATLRGLEPQNPGVRLLRDLGTFVKPTSAGLRLLGHAATRNVADIGPDDVWPFLERKPIPPPAGAALEPGFAVVRLRGERYTIGCGILTRDGLVSQLPDSHAAGLKASLFLAPRARTDDALPSGGTRTTRR